MAEKEQPQQVGDVEDQQATRPAYLDEAMINCKLCCPGPLFNLCPCYVLSFYSVIFACLMGCAKSCCMFFVNCFKGCLNCIKGCFKGCLNCGLTLCSPCIKCGTCLTGCGLKLCSPCIKCGRCIKGCLLSCAVKLNCCNVACGLPCRMPAFCLVLPCCCTPPPPPGCVCIFPCKLCGVAFTCPYFCFSCGCNHCMKMPKDEQRYWFNQKKAKAPKVEKTVHEGGEEALQQKEAPQQLKMAEDPAAMRQELDEAKAENEQLHKQLREQKNNAPPANSA